jgi:hypothetical protein
MRKKRLVHVETTISGAALGCRVWLTTGAHVRAGARVSRAGIRPERLVRLPTRGRNSGGFRRRHRIVGLSTSGLGVVGRETAGCGVGFLAAVVCGQRARGQTGQSGQPSLALLATWHGQAGQPRLALWFQATGA